MQSADKDEILNTFVSMTQCSNAEAARYLEAAQWNAETALEIFFESTGFDTNEPIPSTNTAFPVSNINSSVSKPTATTGASAYESDDENPMQSAIEESLRANAAAKKSPVSKKDTKKNPSTSTKFGTIGGLRDDEESSDEEGQAFYAGGSERSGQQILGPSKSKDNDTKVTKLFEAARKQGAVEAENDEYGSSSQKKKEKAFTGVGYTLGDDRTPSRTMAESLSDAAAASHQVEQLPLRFYSNGFTVGDDELRKYEDNKEFMKYIQRGEVPPELKGLTKSGKQIEVRLEDHRGEEYRPVAPQFKPFGGTGYVLGSPTPNIVSSTTTEQCSMKSATASIVTESNQLEKLAEQKLKMSSSSTVIRLRLPDLSTPIRIGIDLNRTLADVRQFLNENVPSLQSNQFEFIEPPSTKINRENETKTINEAKLTNATLAVRRIS